jgi:hypothetical protein
MQKSKPEIEEDIAAVDFDQQGNPVGFEETWTDFEEPVEDGLEQ